MITIDAKMAWRNVWRNPRRTVLTALAVAFACVLLVFMLSFQFGSYATMINASVRINTGHIQIQAVGFQDDQDVRNVVEVPGRIGRLLDDTPLVAGWTARGRAFALASTAKRTSGAMVVGVDPQAEAQISTLARRVREGHYLGDPDLSNSARARPGPIPALIGCLLAHNLKIGVGDEMSLLGQGRDGSIAATVVQVVGLTTSGIDALDRAAVTIRLTDFQQVFSMGRAVHQIVILAQRLDACDRLAQEIRRRLVAAGIGDRLAVLTWDQLTPGLREAITMDLISGAVFYLILVFVVAFSILNTFLMAIFERTHEFGVLMALGLRPARLVRLVLMESTAITALGAALGIAAGCALTWFFQSRGLAISGAAEVLRQFGISGRIFPRLSLLSASAGPLVVIVVTLATACYPALRIRRLRPVEALSRH